ncbi:MAG: class I SAM-dependent methyltransferase [Gemmataceae bacterium]|nr:class I SAM-dependent methyltransferase [Gemmataceae bacterium]
MPEPATPFDDGVLFDLGMDAYDHDVEFYLGLARAANGPILDLACGTGRMMLRCLEAGLDVEGVDLSPALLARLQQKAATRGLKARVAVANMTAFALPRRFALIMICCNTFVHNLTTEDQLATLRRCRAHLAPGGVLAFDTFFPDPKLIMTPDNTRVLEGEVKHPDTGLPVRCYDTRSFDRVRQWFHSKNEIEFLDAAGNIAVTHRSETTARWIYKGEMELLLRLAGFERHQIFGAFDRRPLERETDALIVLAEA